MAKRKDKIGRYEIKNEIGRGGMATVFLCYDPQFNREVAVKMLPVESLHDPQFRGRFKTEAQTIAALEHPAIVPVYDYGEEGDQPYLVMRYMLGGSLGERLKNGPVSLEKTVQIIQQIAFGLDAASRNGVVHRDLKPDNILFDEHSNAHIADFGIAKLLESKSNLTGDAIIGTPAYMSPEQALGEEEIDGRSDQYALGIIFFEMLTGEQPFKANSIIGLVMKHVRDPIPSIVSFQPNLPPKVDDVLFKVLAKQREDRFDTAGEFSEAIQEAIKDPGAVGKIQDGSATPSMEDEMQWPGGKIVGPKKKATGKDDKSAKKERRGFGKRIGGIVGKIMAPAEDPRQSFTNTFNRQLEALNQVRIVLEELTGAKISIEAKIKETNDRLPEIDDIARRGINSGRDDLARMALVNKQAALIELESLKHELDELAKEEDRLILIEERLTAELDSFYAKQKAISARHTAAEAQLQINEMVNSVSQELSDLGKALSAAEVRAEDIRVRASDLDRLIVNKTELYTKGSTHVIMDKSDSIEIDKQLAVLKLDLDKKKKKK